MNLIQSLDQIDQKIFLFINSLHCPLMDTIMWQISGRILWLPLYLTIIYFFIRKRKWNVWITLVTVAIMILLSDQLADVVKNSVQRLRPTHNPAISGLVHVVRNYRGGDFGFVSNHAANSFAAAAFVSMFFARRWLTIVMFCWASLVGYSRVYLGVHYPFDVLGGAILGFVIGMMMFYTEQFFQNKYFKAGKQPETCTLQHPL